MVIFGLQLMNWIQFLDEMDSLERKIQQVDCHVAPTVKQQLDTFRDQLLDEQANYALGSETYLKRLNELFSNLHAQGCLFPKGSEGAAVTYFDELVKHAMITGTYDVLEKWGVQPFSKSGVQAMLGYSKDTFIEVFEYKAYEAPFEDIPPTARPYYQYLAKAFIEKLND